MVNANELGFPITLDQNFCQFWIPHTKEWESEQNAQLSSNLNYVYYGSGYWVGLRFGDTLKSLLFYQIK